MEKCVTLGKKGDTEKWVKLGKMGHISIKGAQTWKSWSHLEKWVTFQKLGQA